MKPIVAVMARAPSADGKSRLIRALGTGDGVGLRSALLRDTFESVSPLDAEKAVLFTPRRGEAEIRALTPFPATYLLQRGATLGERMRNGLRDLLACGFDAIVLIGSDLPSLPTAHVSKAMGLLSELDDALVLGPAEDGGYYLIGLTRVHDELFKGIPWGSALVLRRTLDVAAMLGINVQLLPAWYDVDSPSDLRRLRSVTDGPQLAARHTRAWMTAATPAVRACLESEAI